MDHEYLKRDKVPTDSSEALVHETSPYYRSTHEKRVSGYTPHPAEKEERGEPRELFSMKNSYNDLSIGADKKGDMMLTGSAARRHNGASLENDEKRVTGSRRKKQRNNTGELYTNPAKPDQSAFAYRVNRKVPEKKILKKLRESAKRHDLARFNDTLSFIDVRENEEQLQELRRERVSESEKQALEKTIRDKKGMEQKFLKNLRFARKKLLSTDLDELRAVLFGEHPDAAAPAIPLTAAEDSEDESSENGEDQAQTQDD